MLHKHTARDLRTEILSGKVSATEVIDHFRKRSESINPIINAIISVDWDRALDRARELDSMLARGRDAGALYGIPIGVKGIVTLTWFRRPGAPHVHAAHIMSRPGHTPPTARC